MGVCYVNWDFFFHVGSGKVLFDMGNVGGDNMAVLNL